MAGSHRKGGREEGSFQSDRKEPPLGAAQNSERFLVMEIYDLGKARLKAVPVRPSKRTTLCAAQIGFLFEYRVAGKMLRTEIGSFFIYLKAETRSWSAGLEEQTHDTKKKPKAVEYPK